MQKVNSYEDIKENDLKWNASMLWQASFDLDPLVPL